MEYVDMILDPDKTTKRKKSIRYMPYGVRMMRM